jgi:hypothetical protein
MEEREEAPNGATIDALAARCALGRFEIEDRVGCPMLGESEITALLLALREGDRSALNRLFPLVYVELRDRAHHQLAPQAG